MSYPGTRETNHAENVKRKADRVQGLEALLSMHEGLPYEKRDNEYIRKLKFKLRFARTQLNHIRP